MKTNKWVRWWLMTGLFMLMVQVMVGGITRLTGSGLSITKWDIVTGSIPPTSDFQWEKEFSLYKKSPQYKEINSGMEMGSVLESGTFKFIYFWEWVHRFWARIMGLVFMIPLCYFLFKRWIQRPLLKRLGVVFLLAGLAASFGWLMVASGLVNRPWVNAYKLAMHLTIAFTVYAYLLNTYFLTIENKFVKYTHSDVNYSYQWIKWITVLLWIQIFLGGIMSGMKAGVSFPTWPDMNGSFIPQVLFNKSEWSVDNFNNYDQNIFMPALIHVLHRSTAYILALVSFWFIYKLHKRIKDNLIFSASNIVGIVLISQILLGIVTVISCQGTIPVGYGVAHQMTALFLLTAVLYLKFKIKISVSK